MRAMSVDIETLDNVSTAAIIAIGAVTFDPYAPEFTITGSMYNVVSIDDQDRSIGDATLSWWMTREEDARLMFVDKNKVILEEALDSLSCLCHSYEQDLELDEIWGKPVHFDIAILQHAFSQYGMEVPWQHRAGRCMRTLTLENPRVLMPVQAGDVKHHALSDAMLQARWIWQIRKYQRELNTPERIG